MADIMNEETERSSDESICTPMGFNPNIIGLYGVPGAGKSYYLSKRRVHSKSEVTKSFQFFEGSSVINSLISGGLPAFKELTEDQKLKLREKALRTIEDECTASRTARLVAGHAMFCNEDDDDERIVITPKDLEVYSHILYLRIDPEVIQQHRLSDSERDRGIVSVEHLEKWQKREENTLRRSCRAHGIYFHVVSPQSNMESEDMFLTRLWRLVSDLGIHNEHINWSNAARKIIDALDSSAIHSGQVKTMLVMDADKTLAPQDAGNIFWKKVSSHGASKWVKNP